MEAYYKLDSYDGTGYRYPARFFKGETDLIIDFSNLINLIYPIIKIEIDFNDGSPNHIADFSYSDDTKLQLNLIKHKYFPHKEAYNVYYYPTIYVTNLIFSRFAYQLPIRISKDSFYSKYKNLNIASAQIIDNPENSLFLMMDTPEGDNVTLKIK